MNYIRHLNGVFEKFRKDDRLNTTHISLYWALFHFANLHRFPKIFYIDRAEIMENSKIGSRATYHKCMRDLDGWGYLQYFPSHNPYKGSKISLFNFETSTEPVVNKYGTSTEQVLGRNNKPIETLNKQEETIGKAVLPKHFSEVFDCLKISDCAINFPEEKLKAEARKFFNHYSANGWKIGGKMPMENWRPAAENWLLKAAEFESEKNTTNNSGGRDNLHTGKSKNYHQPL